MRNQYADFLHEQGDVVFNVSGVDWWVYGGFLMPAYLPGKAPVITPSTALEALKLSGKPFVRWETKFGELNRETDWWHVLKRGEWDIAQVRSKSKRYLIRQGRKNFVVRFMQPQEVIDLAPAVAEAATSRYKVSSNVETRSLLQRRLRAGEKVPNVLEYVGCFQGDRLASWAENVTQGDVVWVTTIRHDPEFLRLSSSYALVDGLLEIYLNQRRVRYFLDGCRNIHHKTEFQDQLEKAFAFERGYSNLNVVYSWWFGSAVRVAKPFSKWIVHLAEKRPGRFIDNVAAVLKQEAIRHSCHVRIR